MRTVIATGIYPPDIGGPAHYAGAIAAQLRARGEEASIVTYAEQARRWTDVGTDVVAVSRTTPPGIRHFRFARALWRATRGADTVVVLDTFSAAIPAALVCLLRGIPFVVRVGGDFVWEKAVEEGRTQEPLRTFYRVHAMNLGERLRTRLIRWMLHRASHVIFSTRFQKELGSAVFGLEPKSVSVLENPIDTRTAAPDRVPTASLNATIVYAGRLVSFKNVSAIVDAFDRVAAKMPEMRLRIIGDGPQATALRVRIAGSPVASRISLEPALPKAQMLEVLAHAWLFVLPSLTDISPNTILDCLHVGTGFVVTRENGFVDFLQDSAVMVDPTSVDELAQALLQLASPEALDAYRARLAKVRVPGMSWEVFGEKLHRQLQNVCES